MSTGISASYLAPAFHHEKVEKFLNALKQLLANEKFDTIAFRGMSGALIGPLAAFTLDKEMLLVRKPKRSSEDHHSWLRVEGYIASERYLIIDDMRYSGNTIQSILTDIREAAPQARCIGVVLYYNFMTYGDPLKLEITREMFAVARSSIVSSEEPIEEPVKPPVVEPALEDSKPYMANIPYPSSAELIAWANRYAK